MLRILSAIAIACTFAAPARADTIVLAGGCFWGMEAVFQHVNGVSEAMPGYAGGEADTAHYDMVSTGTTGHAEAVQVTYDPKHITLEQLLNVYFLAAHNPTEFNYQGPDHGTQYRSAIFIATPQQAQTAKAVMEKLKADHKFDALIVTTLEPLKQFYPAEEYHRNYAALHPYNPYIVMNDLPRVANVKKYFPELYVEKKA
jgi:peptide-methionine (S)-S-oxide reductase